MVHMIEDLDTGGRSAFTVREAVITEAADGRRTAVIERDDEFETFVRVDDLAKDTATILVAWDGPFPHRIKVYTQPRRDEPFAIQQDDRQALIRAVA